MSATATLERGTHTYTADGVDVPLCVSDVLRLSGITQPYPEVPSVMNFVEHARLLGETVHDWCDYLDNGGEEHVAILEGSEPLPYVLAYQRFREEHAPDWEQIEQSFASKGLGCAGTPDRIGSMVRGKERRPVIIDIKTPKSAEKHWQIQLSAYQYLSGRLDCSLFVVHLAGDGSYKVRPYESDVETFLSALRVAQWRMENGAKKR